VLLCGGDACFFKQGGDGVGHVRVRIGGEPVVVKGLLPRNSGMLRTDGRAEG
jgi:hypothetical protein